MASCTSADVIVKSDPPLTLVVSAARGISNVIVRGALDEATAIWNAAGVTVAWHMANGPSAVGEPSLLVTIDETRGTVLESEMPLGWITFSPSGLPERELHLSYRNAIQLMELVNAYRSRPEGYKELLLARGLGRALAHELGHYLLATKDHSRFGLMKGRRLAEEFFSPTRSGFGLNDQERRLAVHGLAVAGAERQAPAAAAVEPVHGAAPRHGRC